MQTSKGQLQLLIDLTRREFKVRYLGSILGSYWNLVHPIIMILIYTLIFSKMMKAKIGNQAGAFSYTAYLCSGLLAWNFFSEIVNRGTITLLDNAGFLKKLSLPPYVLFGASLLSAFVNFIIAFGIFLIVLLFIKPISPLLLFLYFVIIAMLAAFGLGLSISLGCLNVFTRDFQQLTTVLFQLWFWFTPVVYLTETLPDFAKELLVFNPAYAFLEPLHECLYFDRVPEPKFWGLMLIWVCLSLGFASFVYRKLISQVRDQL